MVDVSGWLCHDEIMVMDNAAIHTSGESGELEQCFWETIIDGRPLHILVIYLPTRSPELNPIERIFHILHVESSATVSVTIVQADLSIMTSFGLGVTFITTSLMRQFLNATSTVAINCSNVYKLVYIILSSATA
jgi:hypothetical protein